MVDRGFQIIYADWPDRKPVPDKSGLVNGWYRYLGEVFKAEDSPRLRLNHGESEFCHTQPCLLGCTAGCLQRICSSALLPSLYSVPGKQVMIAGAPVSTILAQDIETTLMT